MPLSYEGFSEGSRVHRIVSCMDNKTEMPDLSRGYSIRKLRAWWSPHMLEDFLDNNRVSNVSNNPHRSPASLTLSNVELKHAL